MTFTIRIWRNSDPTSRSRFDPVNIGLGLWLGHRWMGDLVNVYPDGSGDLRAAPSVTIADIDPANIWKDPVAPALAPAAVAPPAVVIVMPAKRDGNGSLICQGACGQPFPLAEPDAIGVFICRSCRSYREMVG